MVNPETPARLLTGVDHGWGVEFLVTIWPDGAAQIATRGGHRETWSAPIDLRDEDTGP